MGNCMTNKRIRRIHSYKIEFDSPYNDSQRTICVKPREHSNSVDSCNDRTKSNIIDSSELYTVYDFLKK